MRRTIAAVCITASVLLWGTGVDAAKPLFEKIPVDDSGVDEFFTEVCGFEVIATSVGHFIVRESPDRTVGAVRVVSVNVQTTLSANGNEYALRDVGADVARITPDGQVILSIIGQLPFDFTGVLKINLTTGDVVLEPHHSTAGDFDNVCATLAA